MTSLTPMHIRRFVTKLTAAASLPILLVVASATLYAQAVTVTRIGNDYIAAHVVTSPKSGRFWFTGGTYYGDSLKYTYASGPAFITSNLVFRIDRGGVTRYYCNLSPTTQPNNKPIDPTTGQAIAYRAFDSVYSSGDTLALVYRNLEGFDLTVRYMPEQRRTIHDRGSDMLIEFDYVDTRPSVPIGIATIGIMMMLDTYNNNAVSSSGGAGDGSSVLTSSGYYPSKSFGKKFQPPFEQIPEWYMAGNFTTNMPLNTVHPVHRLRDTSHGGRRMTTPGLFAIGDWNRFRTVGWDLPANLNDSIFNDAATIVHWDSLSGEGKVLTAFGTNDREGNNMFTCRDTSLFVSMRTQRLLQQMSAGAPYPQPKFDVEMWVTNTEHRYSNNVSIELVDPISTLPQTEGRLVLDPSTPKRQDVALAPGATKKIRWTLNATPGSASSPDTVNAQLRFLYIYAGKPLRQFRQPCAPTITLLDYRTPRTDFDTMPPIVRRSDSATTPQIYWEFEAFDRHPGYRFDTGIDKIVVDQALSRNIGFEMSGGTRCDTTSTYRPRFVVIDIRKPAAVYFDVFDCDGNSTRASIIYTPPADTMPPVLVRTRQGTVPNTYWDLDAFDRHAGYRFDSGIDRVVVDNTRSSNFVLTMEGGTRCDTLTTLQPRFTVINDQLPGIVYFDAFDCAGNRTSDSIVYPGRVDAVDDEIVPGSGLLIESVVPNPVTGSEVLVSLRNRVAGRISATLVTVDGVEIPCSLVEPAGDKRLRIVLPVSLPGGFYQLRISGEKGSDGVGLRYVP